MMEDNLTQIPQVSQQPEIQAQPPKPLLKIILIVILCLILAGGLVYAGMQIGKRQSQISVSPTPTPTAQTERIDCQTDSDCVLVIGKKDCCSCPTPVNKSELARNENLKIYQEGEILERGKECKDIMCSPCPWWSRAICESGLCKGVGVEDLTPTAAPIVTEPTSTPNLIAGWKTYTNTKHRYSISYPINWEVKDFPESDGYVEATSLNPDKVTDRISAIFITVSPNSYEVEAIGKGGPIKVGSFTAKKVHGGAPPGATGVYLRVVAPLGTKSIIFESDTDYEAVFDQILSTFKFLE